jgi:uncharacterized membrane protein
MTVAGRFAGTAIVAMVALQLAWHGAIAPPAKSPPWVLAAVFAAPMLPALALLLVRHRRAAFWGAVAALLYFCHGVMIAWVSPGERWLGLAEAALSAVLIVAASWDGLQRRFSRRPAPRAGL